MVRQTKIVIENEERDAIELDFEMQNEQWNEYKLLDGGKVRLKTTPLKIFRVLDAEGKPAYTTEGDPFFLVRHDTNVTSTE